MSEVIRIVDEIKQMRAQYVDEVGIGRRAWPKSIRIKIFALIDCGVKPKAIAELTEVPYETVCNWKYARTQRLKKSFHQIAIKEKSSLPVKAEKNVTVTVPNLDQKPVIEKLVTVTVTSPQGIKIEGLPIDELKNILDLFRGK